MPRLPLLILAAILAVPPTGRAADPLPADLALVPPSAVGFVHVRVRDLAAHDAFKPALALLGQAGPDALALFDGRFAPTPSTVDRLTTVVFMTAERRPGRRQEWIDRFDAALVVRCTTPLDREAVAKSVLGPSTLKSTVHGKEVVTDSEGPGALYFPDNRTAVYGPPAAVAALLAPPGAGDHPFAAALAEAATANTGMTAAVARKNLLDADALANELPEPVRPLGAATLASLSLTLAAKPTLVVRLRYDSPVDAADAHKAVLFAAAEGRKGVAAARADALADIAGRGRKAGVRPLDDMPEAVGGLAKLVLMNTADGWLKDLPVAVAGDTVTGTLTLPPEVAPVLVGGAVAAGLALPAVKKVGAAADRITAENNLKQIALAMHNYESANNKLPAAAITDKAGKPLLSWRMAILPYIEQEQLYKQFKMDEPWDSDNNKKLIPLMPKTYADPRVPLVAGQTYYKVFTGPNGSFDMVKGRGIVQFPDGVSNTILVAAGGDPVIWTKPDDIPFDKTKPAPDLTKPFDVLLVAFADGSVRTLNLRSMKDSGATLKLLIDPADGMIIPDLDK